MHRGATNYTYTEPERDAYPGTYGHTYSNTCYYANSYSYSVTHTAGVSR